MNLFGNLFAYETVCANGPRVRFGGVTNLPKRMGVWNDPVVYIEDGKMWITEGDRVSDETYDVNRSVILNSRSDDE